MEPVFFLYAYAQLELSLSLSLYSMALYADMILPVPLNQLFTYLVPESLERNATPGVRAYVPFGKGRRLTGIIAKTHNVKPSTHTVKEILGPSTRPQHRH